MTIGALNPSEQVLSDFATESHQQVLHKIVGSTLKMLTRRGDARPSLRG